MHVLEVESTGARADGAGTGTPDMPVVVIRVADDLAARASHRPHTTQRTPAPDTKFDLTRHRAAGAGSLGESANPAQAPGRVEGQGWPVSPSAQPRPSFGNDHP